MALISADADPTRLSIPLPRYGASASEWPASEADPSSSTSDTLGEPVRNPALVANRSVRWASRPPAAPRSESLADMLAAVHPRTCVNDAGGRVRRSSGSALAATRGLPRRVRLRRTRAKRPQNSCAPARCDMWRLSGRRTGPRSLSVHPEDGQITLTRGGWRRARVGRTPRARLTPLSNASPCLAWACSSRL